MTQKQPEQFTPEQQKDLDQRVKAFNGELVVLLQKYKLGLRAQAIISAVPQLFDDSKRLNNKVEISSSEN